MSDEPESGDRAERFIKRFYSLTLNVYVGPFATKDAALKYPLSNVADAAGETVMAEVLELLEPRHYGPPHRIGSPEGDPA